MRRWLRRYFHLTHDWQPVPLRVYVITQTLTYPDGSTTEGTASTRRVNRECWCGSWHYEEEA